MKPVTLLIRNDFHVTWARHALAPKLRSIALALSSAASLMVPMPVGLAATVIDTTPTWNPAVGVGPFGDNGIETYGQTFIAPAESRLDQITLFLDDELRSGTVTNPAYLDFKVYVAAWNVQRASGPLLFQSAKLTTTDNHGAGGKERFDIATGGLNLVTGGSYVFFFSDSGLFDGNASTGAAGFLGEFAPDVYTGGEFVCLDNQQDTSRWTIAPWQNPFPGKDLAFTLSFSPVPEPATGALLMLSLGACALFRRRRSRLPASGNAIAERT